MFKSSPSGVATPDSFGSDTPLNGARSPTEAQPLLNQPAGLDSQLHSGFVMTNGDYGTMGNNSRQAAAFATLPHRLARSASVARKAERIERRKSQWKSFSTKSQYYVPVLSWLPSYSLAAFGGDVTAAFTLTSMLVPQAMSYASNLAGLPPVTGLFGAAIPPIIYSFFGTCRQLSVGPEAALSLLVGEAVTGFISAEEHAHGDMSQKAKVQLALLISTIITFEAGVITLALGLLRLGFLDAVLSRALLRGFMTAVGVVIFASQAIPILGLEAVVKREGVPVDTAFEKVGFALEHIPDTHMLTFVVSMSALALLVLAKLFKAKLASRRGMSLLKYIPEVLFVVIASTIISAIFDWDSKGLAVLGHVSAGQASFGLPFTNGGGYLKSCIGTSTVIAVLGFLDSIVAAKDCAGRFDYPISPNRELVALGMANFGASFVSGTLPGYGSVTRSRLAGQTGATTQMTGLLTGTFILLVTFFLLGFLFALPKCILAVIICVVVFSILAEAPHDVKFFWSMRAWVELSLMSLTFFLSLLVNVEVGIIVSVAISMMLCIKQSASMKIKILGRVPGTHYYEPLDDDDDSDGLFPSQEEIPGVLIVRIRDVSLTFANAGALKERLRRLERYGKGHHHPSDQPRRAEASVIVFHLADVEDMDASALQLMNELVESYAARAVLIYWTAVNPAPLERLRKSGVIALSGGEHHVHPTVQDALDSINDSVTSMAHP